MISTGQLEGEYWRIQKILAFTIFRRLEEIDVAINEEIDIFYSWQHIPQFTLDHIRLLEKISSVSIFVLSA